MTGLALNNNHSFTHDIKMLENVVVHFVFNDEAKNKTYNNVGTITESKQRNTRPPVLQA